MRTCTRLFFLLPVCASLVAIGHGAPFRRRNTKSPSELTYELTTRVRSIFGQSKKKRQEDKNSIVTPKPNVYNPLQMYRRCMGIVLVWITAGTLFYSFYNDWPLPQSFFYAVDAGMSIGFCVEEVYETKLVSKAFTIIFILLGASVISGALALFIQDSLESLVTPAIDEYQVMLEREAFEKADVDKTGDLSYEEFESLIRSNFSSITQEDIHHLWDKFDRFHDGVIHFEEFAGNFRRIDQLVESLNEQHRAQLEKNPIYRIASHVKLWMRRAWRLENRIFSVFLLWLSGGIAWGILDQKWDPITATHFAVSALATGGLTGPNVNADGILPADPAIFCGVFCLLGIPLFALTLGHFARVLVAEHVAALERSALTRPITQSEYDLAARLTTPKDNVVHLSDFIVLQLLRQGKLSVEGMEVLKHNFDLLDKDGNGALSLEEATRPLYSQNATKI